MYVHHITGYAGQEYYKGRADLLESAGFVCLRSEKGKDGKYWEVWYLPGAYAAEGPIKDKTPEEIKSWVLNEVRPGNLEIVGENWGLSPDG